MRNWIEWSERRQIAYKMQILLLARLKSRAVQINISVLFFLDIHAKPFTRRKDFTFEGGRKWLGKLRNGIHRKRALFVSKQALKSFESIQVLMRFFIGFSTHRRLDSCLSHLQFVSLKKKGTN